MFWCVEYAQLNSAIHFLSILHFPSEPGRVALSFSAQAKCCAIHLLMHRLCNDGCIFISGLYEACSERVTLIFSLPPLIRKGRGGREKPHVRGSVMLYGLGTSPSTWNVNAANADGQEPKSEPPQGAREQSEEMNYTRDKYKHTFLSDAPL